MPLGCGLGMLRARVSQSSFDAPFNVTSHKNKRLKWARSISPNMNCSYESSQSKLAAKSERPRFDPIKVLIAK